MQDPRIIFGVHSLTPYDYKTGLPYGFLQVLGSSTFALNGEVLELNGGSAKYPWAVEEGNITAELKLKTKEYPDFLMELFLGKKPTVSVDAGGAVSTIVNKKGTSVVHADGIASVGIKTGAEADLKFTKYIVKVVSATTVDIYAVSNVDFSSGAEAKYQDELLKINATPLAIVGGAATEVPNFGIEITGGTGTVGMTVGDTGTFEVKSQNASSMEVLVGGTSDVFPTFGAVVMAQKRGNGEMVELDIFKLKAVGLPFTFDEKAFSEAEITAKASYDASQGGVFKIRHIQPE